MKSTVLAVLLVLGFLAQSPAQVTMEVTLDQEQFLPAESLPVAVKITNRSGRTLKFGDREDWLTFTVEGRDGYVVEKLSEAPVLGEFELESGKVATRRVDLAPHFTLVRPGGYQIEASLKIKEWDGLLESKPKKFDVVEGAVLWTKDFGVPPAPGATNTPPEIRRYTFLQANYLRSELRLYFRVSDEATGRILKTYSIGKMVTSSAVEPQLDKQNNVHLVYQFERAGWRYVKISPDGELLVQQKYEYGTSRPRLKTDELGEMIVAGGVRVPASTDLPAEKPATNSVSQSQK